VIPSSVYFSIINFALFIGLMVWVLRKPLAQYLRTRRETFEIMLVESQKARRDAEQKLAEYEHRIARLEADIAEVKRIAQEEGERDRAAIIDQAKGYAIKLKTDTQRMIAQELRSSKEQLKGTTIDLAIVLAERMLRQQLKPADQVRLVKGFVQQLERLN
jgi:F-type H+-transporting ATPase subunit b